MHEIVKALRWAVFKAKLQFNGKDKTSCYFEVIVELDRDYFCVFTLKINNFVRDCKCKFFDIILVIHFWRLGERGAKLT
jgi:hypothetical protein